MSLADRLAQARRSRTAESESSSPVLEAHAAAARRSSDPFVELKRTVHASLLESLGPQLYDAKFTQADLEQKVRHTLHEVLAQEETPLSVADRARIAQEVADDILGYGPLEPYLRDPEITEIMVNGPNRLYVERAGRLYPVATSFVDEAHLRRTIDKIVAQVGRRVDESSPMVDARLSDGSRINAVVSPVAVDGSLLTIRKFATDPYEADDLVGFGTLTPELAEFLRGCVRARLNMLVSGGTGAGKTTTLNVLSSFIPSDERIITIEDAAELQLHQEHVLRLEARPPNIEGRGEIRIRDLVRNALRMRPDRIVVGEVRDAAALDMLQAMNTGHDGSICTVHANSPRDVLARIETMVLMAGMELPVRAIREQMAGAFDVIVHQARFKDGSRLVTQVTEVAGMESSGGEVHDAVELRDLFVFDHSPGYDERGRPLGRLCATPALAAFVERLRLAGVQLEPTLVRSEGQHPDGPDHPAAPDQDASGE